jgi:hypothetical protein
VDSPFKIGDIVRLKRGGPMMMVSNVELGARDKPVFIDTVWHSNDGGLCSGKFAPELLARGYSVPSHYTITREPE